MTNAIPDYCFVCTYLDKGFKAASLPAIAVWVRHSSPNGIPPQSGELPHNAARHQLLAQRSSLTLFCACLFDTCKGWSQGIRSIQLQRKLILPDVNVNLHMTGVPLISICLIVMCYLSICLCCHLNWSVRRT